MTKVKDITWLAGLLEGEGCFLIHKPIGNHIQIGIALSMSDVDVVARAAKIIGWKHPLREYTPSGANLKLQPTEARPWKKLHRFTVSGALAATWMMMVYSNMGQRRRAKIRKCLRAWRYGVQKDIQ